MTGISQLSQDFGFWMSFNLCLCNTNNCALISNPLTAQNSKKIIENRTFWMTFAEDSWPSKKYGDSDEKNSQT